MPKPQSQTATPPTTAIRVTAVLDHFKEPWMLDWYCKVGKREANQVSKAAMKIGSKVDEIIKSGRVMSFIKEPIEVQNCIRAYDKWHAVYQPKSITPCTRLFATVDGTQVTGEPDIMVDDVLVDIKCATKISLKHWIQVNVYRWLEWLDKAAVNEIPVMGRVGILRLDKATGSYEFVVKDYNPRLVDVWCGLLRAYKVFKGDEDGDRDVDV